MYQEVPEEQPWEAAADNAWIKERIHELQP